MLVVGLIHVPKSKSSPKPCFSFKISMNVLERQNVAEHVAFVLTLMVDIIVVAVLVTKIHQAVKKVCRIFYEGRSSCRMAKLL